MKYGQPLPPPAVSPQVGKIIETGREQIHMLESGSADGNPVVLLHGCGSIAEEVMMPFAESGFNIIAPDRPGYGFSQSLPAGERGPLHAFLAGWVAEVRALPLARRVRWSLDVDPIDLY